jgi:flagellar motor protein MotB
MMKLIPSATGGILTNKWVLYFIFVVGIYDVVHFYQRGNMVAFAIFFVVGFLTSFFSKNMTVIIVTSIAIAHLVAYGNRMSEGLENKGEEEEEEGFEDEEEEEGFEDEEEEGESEVKKVKKVKEEDEEEEATAENFDTSELLSKQKELLKSMDSLKPLLKSLSDKKVDGFATMDSLPKFADFK